MKCVRNVFAAKRQPSDLVVRPKNVLAKEAGPSHVGRLGRLKHFAIFLGPVPFVQLPWGVSSSACGATQCDSKGTSLRLRWYAKILQDHRWQRWQVKHRYEPETQEAEWILFLVVLEVGLVLEICTSSLSSPCPPVFKFWDTILECVNVHSLIHLDSQHWGHMKQWTISGTNGRWFAC